MICNVCGATFGGNSSRESSDWENAESNFNENHVVNGLCRNSLCTVSEGNRTINSIDELKVGDAIVRFN